MKKIVTLFILFTLCTFIHAQSSLNVSGTAINSDGEGVEGVFVTLVLTNSGDGDFAVTNDAGMYEFNVELADDASQGCFDLFYIDCNLESIAISDCYNPGNLDFVIDLEYCVNGTDSCEAIIFPEPTGTGLALNVFAFGVAPFTYEWSDGSTGESIIVPLDAEGEYCVVVTDANGCVAEACIDLTPPDPCFVTIFEEYDFTSVLLFAEGYGQTDTLSYQWSTGETGEIISVTESGEYCVTLTDGLGCESIDCKYIEVDTTWIEDCFAYIYTTSDNDTTVTLNVESFGVAPFTYVWSVGDSVISTEATYTPTEAGVYCVEVTDADSCVFVTCYDYFVWEECGVWISCDPTAAGIQLWAFGYGAEPIEYVWSNGDEGPELLVTENGEYCVTITDAEGCTSSSCITVNTDVVECFVPIEVETFEDYAVLSLDLNSDGPYEIIWSNGETGSTITVQESGTYCVEVLEVETGCFFTTCATVFLGGQEDCWGYIETEITGDSTAILTAIAFNNSSDTLAFQYIWETGEATQSIEVSVEGTYCVTVIGSDSCTFTTCVDVFFNDFPWDNIVFGIVYDSQTGEALDASVDLYEVLDDGSLVLQSEDNETFEEGIFFIEGLASGSYIALAVVEGDTHVPTYGYSTTSWEEADLYTIGDNTAIIEMEIAMIPLTNLQGGNGTIEGSVSTANFKANEVAVGGKSAGPLVDANIMLMHSEVPVGQVFSDEDGAFKFSGLPYGTYNVILEIPGQPRKVLEITLSEDNPNATGIEFETDATTSTDNNSTALSSMTLSPNPTSNILVVDSYFEENKDVIYRVIDMNGKIVESSTFNAQTGENNLVLNVETYRSGMYNLVFQMEKEVVVKRFIKM